MEKDCTKEGPPVVIWGLEGRRRGVEQPLPLRDRQETMGGDTIGEEDGILGDNNGP